MTFLASLISHDQHRYVVVAVAVASMYVLRSIIAPAARTNLPQPPSTLPILGNLLDVGKKHMHRFHDWIADESTRVDGKPWLLQIIGRPSYIVVASPELFEDVLKTQANVFQRGKLYALICHDLFGNGIAAVDGDEWVFQRKTASHLFSLQMMKEVMQDVVRDKVRTLCEGMVVYAQENRSISLNRELSHFTSDVFGQIGFGVDLHCLEEGRHGALSNDFVSAFSVCADVIRSRIQQPHWLWRLKRYFNLGTEKENKRALEVINKYMFAIISEYMANKNSNKTDTTKKDLISLFLESKLKSDIVSPQNMKEMQLIRDLIINFTFAGKDTTSQAMCWFIIAMNRNPAVLAKIRAEIRAKLPKLMSGGIQIPDIEELKRLTYLEAAIREQLRLYPTSPMVSRTAEQSTILVDGTMVPKGTGVLLSMYAAGRQTSVWGDDAAEFKPDRWLDPITGDLISVTPFKFNAFLAGPHMCLGMKFAIMEMKIALTALLSRFDLKTVEDPWAISDKLSLTYAVKGPLMVNVASVASVEPVAKAS